tara:strand:- start:247 stop:420 length:174 start_codon:yes stop_codon:yes gene_type:complete
MNDSTPKRNTELLEELKEEILEVKKHLTTITLEIQKERDDYKSKYLSLKELYDKCWL